MIGSDQSFGQKESWGYELSNDIRIVRNGPQFKKLLAKNAYSESSPTTTHGEGKLHKYPSRIRTHDTIRYVKSEILHLTTF